MSSKAEFYKLEKELGSGGFASSWLARDTRLSGDAARCVLKKLHIDKLEHWKNLELFERECKTLKHLNHRGIPRFLDAWISEDPPEAVLVQHYIPGQSLQQWLADGRRFTEVEAIELALQLCDILTYLHSFSPPVIHRDIKPSNLILDPSNQLYLIDFGAVNLTLGASQNSMSYTGTLGYMAIEQFEGQAQPASDLYALGATWLALLTGKAPSEIPKKNLKPDFRVHTRLSKGFSQILDRLLEPDIARRYQEATELAADLRRLKRQPKSTEKTSNQESHWRQTLRLFSLLQIPKPWRVGFALLGLLILGLGLFKLLSPTTTKPVPTETVHQPQAQSLQWQKTVAPWQRLDPAPQIISLSEAPDGMVWGISSNSLYAFKNNQAQIWAAQDLTGQYASLQWLNAELDDAVWFASYDSQLYRWNKHDATQKPQAIALPCAGKLSALGSWQNKLLLGCGKELFVWKNSKHQFDWLGSFSDPVSFIRVDSEQKLLVAARHRLYTYESHTWKQLWQGKNTYDDQIRQITSTPERIYLGLEKSALELDPKRQTSALLLNNAKITGLSVPSRKKIWLATSDTYSEGLYLLESGSKELFHLGWREGLPSDRFQVMLLDQQGQIWLSADYSGQGELIRAPLEAVTKAVKQPALPHLTARRFDNACQAWAGIQPLNTTHLAAEQIQGKTHVFWHQELVCPYGEGYYRSDRSALVQNFRELISWQKGQFQRQALPANVFTSHSLLWDQTGAIWLARSWPNDLLFKPKVGPWRTQSKENGLTAEKPALLYQTRKGQILAASRVKGQLPLQIYDARNQHWQASGLIGADDYIEAQQILELKSGELALASDKGLYIVSANLKESRRVEGLPYHDIQAVAEDSDGTIWVVYKPYGSGRGISRWRRDGKLVHLDSRQGLLPDRFQDMTMDHHNNLWLMGAARKVDVYSREALQKALSAQ